MGRLWRGDDVTVVIPTIEGRRDLFNRAVASVMAQKIQPLRIQVEVDDHRTGAAATRNRAMEYVTTEWVAFLDDDDEFLPNHIKAMLVGANLSGADLIYTYAEFVGGRDPLACPDENGNFVDEPINVPWGIRQEWWLRNKGNFIPVTNMVRTAAVLAVGGFPEPYSFGFPSASHSGDCEDYGLLLALLEAGYTFHHAALGVRTWRYHMHGENTGGRGVDRLHELAVEGAPGPRGEDSGRPTKRRPVH